MNVATKLGVYGAVVALAVAGGALAGAAIGPEPDDDPPAHADAHAEPSHDEDVVAALPGLAISDRGYTLVLDTSVVPADGGGFRFHIAGPDGDVVHRFSVEHDKELHLILASRDLERFVHLHPARDRDGTWSVTLPALPPGAYRAFADFRPEGGPALTLGADITVPGDHQAPPRREASHRSSVDGFDVELLGTPRAGEAVSLVVRTSVGGEPARLEPYLGANGHLVALREGDLAYLHVHPEHADVPGEVPFTVTFPSAGRHRLFFDFQVDGVVHTADFTVDVGDGHAHRDAPEQDGHR